MKRWSCAVEIDAVFDAAHSGLAELFAEAVEETLRARLEGRRMFYRHGTFRIYSVQLNTEPGSLLEMEKPTR